MTSTERCELMDRLRREGRWDDGALFRDRARDDFRAKGLRKGESLDVAWEALKAAFPPLMDAEVSRNDEQGDSAVRLPKLDTSWLNDPEGILKFLLDAVLCEMERWEVERGVMLASEDPAEFVRRMGQLIAFIWMLAALGHRPAPHCHTPARAASCIDMAFNDASEVVVDALRQRRLDQQGVNPPAPVNAGPVDRDVEADRSLEGAAK